MTGEEAEIKWKLVLDFSSKYCPPVPEDDRIWLATLLEETEMRIMTENFSVAKLIIPMVRRTMKPVYHGAKEVIYNDNCLIVEGIPPSTLTKESKKYAIPENASYECHGCGGPASGYYGYEWVDNKWVACKL